MKAFDTVSLLLKNIPTSGHALGNIKNKKSLAIAKTEIEKMLQESKKLVKTKDIPNYE